MTIASLLLALCTAAPSASSDAASQPVLLDFHADWCGPCKQMRPIVRQLIRNNYPVRSIDVDHDPERLAPRYHVDAVPTFIVVDGSGRELDRTGPSSAVELARFYKAAAAKAEASAESNERVASRTRPRPRRDDEESDDEPKARRTVAENPPEDEPDDRAELAFINPKPWETSVRIKVVGPRSTGFGSGTIIHSTPEESLILTCAHIFHLEGIKGQVAPAKFPRQIIIDLFDGKLKSQGKRAAKVDYLESVEGKAVDYDFTRDVGLIRIRPGRQLPASRVVPTYWKPLANFSMITVGCSEGADATVWPTAIIAPSRRNFLSGRPAYEAIECQTAPKQGRSGGGLFTDNGFIAGVCDFAEPQGDHGLYATPRSIYNLLDRNNLMALYAPPTSGQATLLADRRSSGSRPQPSGSKTFARSQSPDREESPRSRATADNSDEVMIPPPALLGIEPDIAPEPRRKPKAASTTRHTNWLPTRIPATPASNPLFERFDPPGDEPDPKSREGDPADGTSPPVDDSKTDPPSKPRWRAVKGAPVDASAAASVN